VGPQCRKQAVQLQLNSVFSSQNSAGSKESYGISLAPAAEPNFEAHLIAYVYSEPEDWRKNIMIRLPREVEFMMQRAVGLSIPELNPLPSEAIFDKITMSAFEGTPLDIALRDCGINAFVIVGIAMEIGIEPTVRHGADLGYIPVIVKDACGFGHGDAAARSFA